MMMQGRLRYYVENVLTRKYQKNHFYNRFVSHESFCVHEKTAHNHYYNILLNVAVLLRDETFNDFVCSPQKLLFSSHAIFGFFFEEINRSFN